jgi:hypothetical protein
MVHDWAPDTAMRPLCLGGSCQHGGGSDQIQMALGQGSAKRPRHPARGPLWPGEIPLQLQVRRSHTLGGNQEKSGQKPTPSQTRVTIAAQ